MATRYQSLIRSRNMCTRDRIFTKLDVIQLHKCLALISEMRTLKPMIFAADGREGSSHARHDI